MFANAEQDEITLMTIESIVCVLLEINVFLGNVYDGCLSKTLNVICCRLMVE